VITEIETVTKVEALRDQVRQWRAAGESVALVPTMGNLHAGHLELARLAGNQAHRSIVSIFVNPMQFGAGEDFNSYPKTFEADRQRLASIGVDLLFAPAVDEIYPRGEQGQTRVEVPGLSDILCGASRPGHFVGVATVVCKLLNMAQPDLALFGEKDYQQLMVIRRMVEDLAMPIKILGLPTVRGPDGLALSSRNGYLTQVEQALAPRLYQTLLDTRQAIQAGERDYPALEQKGLKQLGSAGFDPDYFALRRASDLALPAMQDGELVILAAARLGRARLIDNLRVSMD